ncbi:helix-turn-helix domain-containing protein [Paenibacillus turpanensis]|uniref:helix-turn-helix domain-containing protein n=1 Tax=Paenibacillus turpanensis TaxID=2689078 RepID=UPI00140A93AA|nr:AraC family transcriptional regulator [Paenibacillus turpanensis]
MLPDIRIAGDFVLAPGSVQGPRVIDDYEIIFYLNAKDAVYREADEAYALGKPSVILQKPGVSHRFTANSQAPLRHQFVHFLPGPLLEEQLELWDWRTFIELGTDQLLPEWFNELMRLASAKAPGWKERCGALIFTMVTHLLAGPPVTSGGDRLPLEIQKALEFIEGHLNEPFSIRELSASLLWSHEHFTRSFKQHIGLSPQQYVLNRRIEGACRHMAYHDATMREIAEIAGFQSEHYFSRCFRKIKGVSPSEYRKKAGEYRNLLEPETSVWKAQHPLNTYLFP